MCRFYVSLHPFDFLTCSFYKLCVPGLELASSIKGWLPGKSLMRIRKEPIAMIEKLLQKKLDPNSRAAREIIDEIAERVLRNLSPENQDPQFALSRSTVA